MNYLVYINFSGQDILVGRCFVSKGAHQTIMFEYDTTWLEKHHKIAFHPLLSLDTSSQRLNGLGPFGDFAPDRWGRTIVDENEVKLAKKEKRQARRLYDFDYLLAVDDGLRQGAVRFKEKEGGPFLAITTTSSIPRIINLSQIQNAAMHFSKKAATPADLAQLMAAGLASGGARPKAGVLGSQGELYIAKFKSPEDKEYSVIAWEALSLKLAKKAGINTAEASTEIVDGELILLLKRFDRAQQQRIPFSSAMSLLGGKDHEKYSYEEIAESLQRFGGNTGADLAELWRRMVFNIVISNTDDHLRNHGFIYTLSGGWALSPAYDINPVPAVRGTPRHTVVTHDTPESSVEVALSVAHRFGLTAQIANKILKEVVAAASQWHDMAKMNEFTKKDIDRMKDSFPEPAIKRSRTK